MEAAVSPKQWQPPTRVHGVITQKTKPKLPLVQKNVRAATTTTTTAATATTSPSSSYID
jgi:hypothetical protein